MKKWIILFLSIWMIIASFLFFNMYSIIINNIVVALLLLFYSFKTDGWKKWALLAVVAFLAIIPFLPPLSNIIAQVNGVKKSAVSIPSKVYTRNLLAGILLMIIVYFPEKEVKTL